MREQAIALCRVSTTEQLQNNSLSRQEESVQKASDLLDVEIVKYWSGDVSSKVGKNYNRKDLNEAFDFCKRNRRVKYLIVDEVDRFMRSTQEMFYWMTKFEQEVGVLVHFASNPDHNTADAKARLLLSLEGFKAEGSNEERQHKSIVGHQKAIREGRYTFPPKPAYTRGEEAGIHVPHPLTFKPLQKAFRDVISGLYTPQEALSQLNKSSFAKKHSTWRMDKFRHFAIDPYYAGILDVRRQINTRNEQGKHHAMLSLEEHEELVRIFTGSIKVRGSKKQYNPEFPMNKILTCGDCGSEVKFTGSKKNNGYAKKVTKYYYKYHCRGCSKGYHRDEVHEAVTQKLKAVEYTGEQKQDFVNAMSEVWASKQKDSLRTIKQLEARSEELEATKSKTVRAMITADPEYKDDIKRELDTIKLQLKDIYQQIDELANIKEDLIEFLQFGLNYTNELAEDWWQLTHEDRVRCQQLIFPDGISFNSDKKVGTPSISPIYFFQPNKKVLDFASKTLVEELAGTAPASAGLSWLVIYRLSSF
jgi:DNA invertase Pin-like site-specific DNA recombinase